MAVNLRVAVPHWARNGDSYRNSVKVTKDFIAQFDELGLRAEIKDSLVFVKPGEARRRKKRLAAARKRAAALKQMQMMGLVSNGGGNPAKAKKKKNRKPEKSGQRGSREDQRSG